MKAIRKILKIIFNILVVLSILLVGLIIYNFYQVNVQKSKYPKFFGYTFFEVTTGSMKETIDVNDIILVEITKDVHENDIITFENNEEIITHRIIKESENEITTKGDANNSADKPIKKENVIGKVIKIFPKLGTWLKVFSDFKVIISILITITLFGFALSSKDKENKKKNRHHFSKFMKNLRGMIKNGKKEKTKD